MRRGPELGGLPLMPVCQLNLTEAPYRPESLHDIELITLFVNPESLPSGAENGDGWEVRAYSSIAELTPLPQPVGAKWPIKALPIRWELVEQDFPC